MYHASCYSCERGLLPVAEATPKLCNRARIKALGEAQPDTPSSMANLASTYRNQGWWDEAEELEVKVMEMRKAVLGEAYLDTLSSMDNLAATYRSQRRANEADRIFSEMQYPKCSQHVIQHPLIPATAQITHDLVAFPKRHLKRIAEAYQLSF